MTTNINGELLFSAVESAKHHLEIGTAFISRLYPPQSDLLNGLSPNTFNGTELVFDDRLTEGTTLEQASVSNDKDIGAGSLTGNSFADVCNFDRGRTWSVLFENAATDASSFHEIVSGAFGDWRGLVTSTANQNKLTEPSFDLSGYCVVDNASNIGAEHPLMNLSDGPSVPVLNSVNPSGPGAPLGEPSVSLLSSVNPCGPGDTLSGPTAPLLNSVNPSGPGGPLANLISPH